MSSVSVSGGLTTEEITRRISSDPYQAAELGAVFRAQENVTWETRSFPPVEVSARDNAVNYGQETSRTAADRSTNSLTMVPGGEYTINANGTFEKNRLGSRVRPEDAAQNGNTRLQVLVERDGQVLRRLDYTPGMTVRTQPGEEGANLGFAALDGRNAGQLSDNSGSFRVDVSERRPIRSTTNVAISADDASGIVAAGEHVARALDRAPEAASIPEPSPELATAPPGRGLTSDRGRNEVATPDGYRYSFRDNLVQVYAPGRDEPLLTVNGREVREDGARGRWDTDNNLWVAPNGSMLNVEFDGNNIRRAEVINGDSRVDVKGAGWNDGAVDVGAVRGGGLARRADLVRSSAADLDNLDVTTATGEDLRRILEGGDGRTSALRYFVDEDLRPERGTAQHERMLRSELEDQRNILVGSAMADGADRRTAEMISDYLLGRGNQPAPADRLQRALAEQLLMQQLVGGLPPHFGDMNQAMAAVQQLAQVLAAQQGLATDYSAGANNLRSYIPSVEAMRQSNVPPEMLVDQALRGLQQRGGGRDPLARFDLDRAGMAQRFERDPYSGLIRDRFTGTTMDESTFAAQTGAAGQSSESGSPSNGFGNAAWAARFGVSGLEWYGRRIFRDAPMMRQAGQAYYASRAARYVPVGGRVGRWWANAAANKMVGQAGLSAIGRHGSAGARAMANAGEAALRNGGRAAASTSTAMARTGASTATLATREAALATRTGGTAARAVGGAAAKGIGRLVPALNIGIAALDSAQFVSDLNDPNATTGRKIASGVTAGLSVVAATNIPVVSQVAGLAATGAALIRDFLF